jgi:hypothetical protein
MKPNPGKPLEEVGLYSPISLLPIMSKIIEKTMLKTLRPTVEENRFFLGSKALPSNKYSEIQRS